MSITKTYNPSEVEKKWYSTWMEKKLFRSTPSKDKEPFVVVIPPPNVTGVLHMGHMLNNTIQDILVRRARMQGKEACWVPGTDHASIATETKVVNKLAEEGIKKEDIGRDAFLEHAWEWKEKYGGIILDQLKVLGASCDWDRTKFTMDEDLSASVIKVFVDLHDKGYIYRGVRMVNWDPKGKTALSDEEVNYKEVKSRLFYINYPVVGEDRNITIATTRPETILGDTAICVNPNDERYQSLIGKKVIVPIVNREITIIADEYVDVEFGTGCLKVTPAHDINDYELGLKHKLEVIDIFNDDGTVNSKAGLFEGLDRFVVRKKMVAALKEEGFFVKEEELTNNVGYSERTDVVIEPKLSVQWFCRMQDLAKPALENVMNDTIKIHPAKFKNMYRSWMENIKDWCISRQLWWGHRIPAYYLNDGTCIVAETTEKAVLLAQQKTGNVSLTINDLRQDEDVLDTWFSSWLWPISVFDGINNPENEEFKYYYPTHDLVTGFDIIFFWVARMVMAGYENTNQLPFRNVYFTGMVRDEKGRKMSKQLGNSPDPLNLISKYSADGVRVGMLLSAPAGNDLLFDEKLCEQGRNFTNKLWNSYRLMSGWEIIDTKNEANEPAINWMNQRFNEVLTQIEDDFSKYRISDALMNAYKLVWDDFCAWYLEMIKPEYGKPIDRWTLTQSLSIFDSLLKLLHPFMPFITEELWSLVKERSEGDYIIVAPWPKSEVSNTASLLVHAQNFQAVVTAVRNLRASKQIPNQEKLSLFVKTKNKEMYTLFGSYIQRLAGVSELTFTEEKIEQAATLVIGVDECYVPLEGKIDTEQERANMLKELEYTKGFLASVSKKLGNEKFVANAPAQVLENERKKMADAEAKIQTLEDSLKSLV